MSRKVCALLSLYSVEEIAVEYNTLTKSLDL